MKHYNRARCTTGLPLLGMGEYIMRSGSFPPLDGFESVFVQRSTVSGQRSRSLPAQLIATYSLDHYHLTLDHYLFSLIADSTARPYHTFPVPNFVSSTSTCSTKGLKVV